MSAGIRAERLFTELCNRYFLRGFVFHSPRFYNPDENEAGDVVLWVRRQVIVVEVLSRAVNMGANTKQFVKRIGEKRDQLVKDYNVFKNQSIDIKLVNEQGEVVLFDTRDIDKFGFAGIILVDCKDHIDKLHFRTVKKSLALPFPVAIMTQSDFLDLLSEIDTIPDLTYYLHDRFDFLKEVYTAHPHHFLDLNNRLERNLISFYKINENRFPIAKWNAKNTLGYHLQYSQTFRDKITARDAENKKSYIIDQILEYLRRNNQPYDSTLLHSWELATMTRRQRAGWLSEKIKDAVERMLAGNRRRHFAFFNEVTGCWLVFFFQYGGSSESFAKEAKVLSRQKLFVEMKERGFEHSLFGYAFRKSVLETGTTFDEIILTIEDAANYESIPENDYQAALKNFGQLRSRRIREFPT
jgi:hypothetical protein